MDHTLQIQSTLLFIIIQELPFKLSTISHTCTRTRTLISDNRYRFVATKSRITLHERDPGAGIAMARTSF